MPNEYAVVNPETGYRCLKEASEIRRERRKAAKRKRRAKDRQRGKLELDKKRPVKDPWNPFSLRVARAKVLLESGLSAKKVALATNLHERTVAKVKRGDYDPNIPIALIEQCRATETTKIQLAKTHILDSILEDPRVIEDANLVQRTTAFGILTDKLELLEGRPTSRVDHLQSLSDSEIVEEMRRTYLELQQRLASVGAIDITGATDGELVPAPALGAPVPA